MNIIDKYFNRNANREKVNAVIETQGYAVTAPSATVAQPINANNTNNTTVLKVAQSQATPIKRARTSRVKTTNRRRASHQTTPTRFATKKTQPTIVHRAISSATPKAVITNIKPTAKQQKANAKMKLSNLQTAKSSPTIKNNNVIIKNSNNKQAKKHKQAKTALKVLKLATGMPFLGRRRKRKK